MYCWRGEDARIFLKKKCMLWLKRSMMNIFEAEYAGDQAEYTRRMMKVEQEIEDQERKGLR